MKLYIYKLNFTHRIANAVIDAQQMHKLLTQLTDSSRKDTNLLYRLDVKNGLVYVQSDKPLNDSDDLDLVRQIDMDKVIDKKHNGDHVTFLLKTTPYFHNRNTGYHYFKTEEKRKNSIAEKLALNGIDVGDIRELKRGRIAFRHNENRGGKYELTTYDYLVEGIITDIDAMQHRWNVGFGMDKAYGNGMFLMIEK